jgi:Fe-S cluster biogenesis protein NfuA
MSAGETADSLVPMHPQAGLRPDEVRWIIPPEALSVRGVVVSAPPDLAALLSDGTLTEIRAGHGSITTRAASAKDWRRIGASVRSALSSALSDPGAWRTTDAGSDGSDVDGRIAAAATDLIDGDIGAYARSHGGDIVLVDVQDGVASVRVRGACRGCPAAEISLRTRLETLLRQECPELVAVRTVS